MGGRVSRPGPQRRAPETWNGNRLGLGAFDAHVIWRRCVRWWKSGKRLMRAPWATIKQGYPIMTIGCIQTISLRDRGFKWRNRKA